MLFSLLVHIFFFNREKKQSEAKSRQSKAEQSKVKGRKDVERLNGKEFVVDRSSLQSKKSKSIALKKKKHHFPASSFQCRLHT